METVRICSAQFENLCSVEISNLHTNLQIKLNFKIACNHTCAISKLCTSTCTISNYVISIQAHNFKGQALTRAPSFTEKCYMRQNFSYQTDQILDYYEQQTQGHKIILEEKKRRQHGMSNVSSGTIKGVRRQAKRTVYLLFQCLIDCS